MGRASSLRIEVEGWDEKSLYRSGWEVEKFIQSGGGNVDNENIVKGGCHEAPGWHTYIHDSHLKSMHPLRYGR